MRDGFSDCFESEQRRDDFFALLINRAREQPIPSDTEVCRGESPFVGRIPLPFCVNHRWENGEHSEAWDDWRVTARPEIGTSEDLYAGPGRVEEFDATFNKVECIKIFKDRDIIKFQEVI